MAHRIVKAPNGKYAAFSDPVDHFVAYDMTREDVIKYLIDERQCSTAEAELKLQRADEDITMFGGKGRYEEAMDTIRNIHGAEEEKKYRKLLEGEE
jgi:hypothetical protein